MMKFFSIFISFLVLGGLSFFLNACLLAGPSKKAVSYFSQSSLPLKTTACLDPLIESAQSKKVVLLGEASHGTKEYYLWRKKISRRLIKEGNFSFILVEGDWPSCFKVNLYVKGLLEESTGLKQLLKQSFKRWPRWMWANQEVVALIEWLKEYNSGLPLSERVGFYGMDVYSLRESAKKAEELAKEFDLELAARVGKKQRCFEPFAYDGFGYARAVHSQGYSCRGQTAELIQIIEGKAASLADKNPYAYFNLKMNARSLQGAEEYYRLAVMGGPRGWNSRVYHMKGTLRELLDFHGKGSQAIVWAHNTHVGDARATSMQRQNQVNIGQLSRQAFGPENVFIAGFATYEGEVIAANEWGASFEVMQVPPAREKSIEHIALQASQDPFLIVFDSASRRKNYLNDFYGHRAIGVVYNPGTEHLGNYVPTSLPYRYDAFLFFPRTKALTPLGEE